MNETLKYYDDILEQHQQYENLLEEQRLLLDTYLQMDQVRSFFVVVCLGERLEGLGLGLMYENRRSQRFKQRALALLDLFFWFWFFTMTCINIVF